MCVYAEEHNKECTRAQVREQSYVQVQNMNSALFGQKPLKFLAHFRQLLWRNRLDAAWCTTTDSKRLYDASRIVLACND